MPDGDERPRLDLLGQRGLRQDGDARRDLHGSLDVFDIIEFEHDFDVDVVVAEEAVDRTPDRQVRVEGDERLAVQLGHRHALAMRAKRWEGWTASTIASSRQVITCRSGHFLG